MKNWSRSVVSILLCLTLCSLPLPALGVEQTTGFSDVSPGDWFAPYVAVCVEEGLMRGTGNGRFEPERGLTMAECVMLAVRLDRFQKGEKGPLPHAPEGWGTVRITDGSGTVVFSLKDYQGYGFSGSSNTIYLPQERVAPLAGKPGYLILNGTQCFEGQFILAEDSEDNSMIGHEIAGLSFPDEVLDYSEFDAITEGYYTEEKLTNAPDWIIDAVCYAEEHGLDLGELSYDLSPASRISFLSALEGVTDPRKLDMLNTVEALPDIPARGYWTWGDGHTNGNFGDFYRAGILSGTDKYGTFNGGNPISRAECATILARILRPELRLQFTLTPTPQTRDYTLTPLGIRGRDWWNNYDACWNFPETIQHSLEQQILRVSKREGSEINYDNDGILAADGSWLVEPGRYGEINLFGPDGLAVAATTHYMGTAKYGVIDTQGREIIAPVYDRIGLGGDGLIAAYTEGESAYALFNVQGEPAGQLSGQAAGQYGIREGLALYQEEESGLWGYMDLKGQITVPAQFETAGLFYDGLAAVVQNGKTGYIDHSGTLVIPCQYKAIYWHGEGHFQDGAVIVTDANGKSFILDQTGNQISPRAYDWLKAGFSPNGLAFYQYISDSGGLEQGFVDTKGQEYPMPSYIGPYQIMGYSGGYYLVQWTYSMSYNYMDQTGKLLSTTWFYEASPLTDEGIAIVKNENGEYCRLELK